MAVQDKGQVIHRPAKINRAQAKSCFFWSKKGGGVVEDDPDQQIKCECARACIGRRLGVPPMISLRNTDGTQQSTAEQGHTRESN